jgi:hypothetical protein
MAATLARKMVRVRTGSSPRIRQSRRSGSTVFQASTANRPATAMVEAMRNSNSLRSAKRSCAGEALTTRYFGPAKIRKLKLNAASIAANWTSSFSMSPCDESTSRSTMRRRKSRYRIPN